MELEPSAYEDYSSEDEDDYDEDEERELTKPNRDAVYNNELIEERLRDIAWVPNVEWLQTLSLVYADESIEEVDVNDDLSRELAFYTQALEGVKESFTRLKKSGIPIFRPVDYYAEMVKTDSHMLKVKEKLLSEKRTIEEKDERRKQREAKKYAKEVQAEKMKERTKQKKSEIQAVKQWRKGRKDSGFADDADDFPIDLDNNLGESKAKKRTFADRSMPSGGQQSRVSKKRVVKDSKYGFGGRKRLKKQNTAESSADMDGFGGANVKDKFLGKRAGNSTSARRNGKKKVQRPGKARRQQARGNK